MGGIINSALKDTTELTDEQKEKFIKWFGEKKTTDTKCSVCGTHSWDLLNHIVAPTVFANGALHTGPVYPYIMVLCKNCGNTLFFNAAQIGILVQEEK